MVHHSLMPVHGLSLEHGDLSAGSERVEEPAGPKNHSKWEVEEACLAPCSGVAVERQPGYSEG